MATEVDIQALIWALGILAVPVVGAIPLRFIWRFWIGGGHEESEYRTTVRQIIDAGRQIESYRHALNDIARSLRLTPSCLLYTSPSPRDATLSRMPSSA